MDTGFVIRHGEGVTVIYDHEKHCKALLIELRRRDHARLWEGQLHAFLNGGALPPVRTVLGTGATLDSLDAYEAALKASEGVGRHTVAIQAARRFVTATAKDRKFPSAGIGLVGLVGCGKSTLLACCMRDLLRVYCSERFGDMAPCPVTWILEQDLWKRLTDAMHSRDDTDTTGEYLESLRESPVLVIDNLGGQASGRWWVDTILFGLIETRLQAGLPTCWTTKRQLDALKVHWESGKDPAGSVDDLIDRLRQGTAIVPITGQSLRTPQVDF